jgi:hypothetical protein
MTEEFGWAWRIFVLDEEYACEEVDAWQIWSRAHVHWPPMAGEGMYHTHVFICKNDWFWVGAVMTDPLHAYSHPSMLGILQINNDYCSSKNCSDEVDCALRPHCMDSRMQAWDGSPVSTWHEQLAFWHASGKHPHVDHQLLKWFWAWPPRLSQIVTQFSSGFDGTPCLGKISCSFRLTCWITTATVGMINAVILPLGVPSSRQCITSR